MPEIKGKMEITYCWRCSRCGEENAVLDGRDCPRCGKEAGDEKVLRHFKLTPEPMRLGWRT